MNEGHNELGVTIDGHSVINSTSECIKSKSWQGMYDVLYSHNCPPGRGVRIASLGRH